MVLHSSKTIKFDLRPLLSDCCSIKSSIIQITLDIFFFCKYLNDEQDFVHESMYGDTTSVYRKIAIAEVNYSS